MFASEIPFTEKNIELFGWKAGLVEDLRFKPFLAGFARRLLEAYLAQPGSGGLSMPRVKFQFGAGLMVRAELLGPVSTTGFVRWLPAYNWLKHRVSLRQLAGFWQAEDLCVIVDVFSPFGETVRADQRFDLIQAAIGLALCSFSVQEAVLVQLGEGVSFYLPNGDGNYLEEVARVESVLDLFEIQAFRLTRQPKAVAG